MARQGDCGESMTIAEREQAHLVVLARALGITVAELVLHVLTDSYVRKTAA